MVARLDRCSVSLAQNPKSARVWLAVVQRKQACSERTNLDVATAVEEHVVTLDVSVNNVLVMEVLQALAGLYKCKQLFICHGAVILPQSKWWQSGLR